MEDDDEVRFVLSVLIRKLGHRTQEAENAAAGLEIFKQDKDIAAIYTDVVLPGGMSGVDLAKACRETRSDLPIVFTSGYAAEHINEELNTVDDIFVVTKPVDMKNLAHVLSEAINGAVLSDKKPIEAAA